MPATRERRRIVKPRPGPERSFFDFDLMGQQLVERIQQRFADSPINISLGGEAEKKRLGHIEAPKFTSRWRGKTGIIRGVVDIRKLLYDTVDKPNWLAMHPARLAEAMFTRNTGKAGFKRGTRQYKKALRLREKYAPHFKRICDNFMQQAQQAMNELAKAVQEGKVNWNNRNFYAEKFDEAVKQAEAGFEKGRDDLMRAYAVEWKKK